jgi:CheY-like chemotaxis protein
MVRIMIADDSQPVRRGLRTLLGLNPDWKVCREAVDGADAVESYELAPDLILMDFSMPQMDGVQAARKIAEFGTDIPILLFTLSLSPQAMELARNAGLRGDFKVGSQQVAICDHGASARRDLLLFDLRGGVTVRPEVGEARTILSNKYYATGTDNNSGLHPEFPSDSMVSSAVSLPMSNASLGLVVMWMGAGSTR